MANTADIRPLGTGSGVGYYWVQEDGMFGRRLIHVAINERGDVMPTGLSAQFDSTALTKHEAVVQHLGPGIAQADAELERRRKEAPEPELDPEPPMDPATRKFYGLG